MIVFLRQMSFLSTLLSLHIRFSLRFQILEMVFFLSVKYPSPLFVCMLSFIHSSVACNQSAAPWDKNTWKISTQTIRCRIDNRNNKLFFVVWFAFHVSLHYYIILNSYTYFLTRKKTRVKKYTHIFIFSSFYFCSFSP